MNGSQFHTQIVSKWREAVITAKQYATIIAVHTYWMKKNRNTSIMLPATKKPRTSATFSFTPFQGLATRFRAVCIAPPAPRGCAMQFRIERIFFSLHSSEMKTKLMHFFCRNSQFVLQLSKGTSGT